MQLDGRSMYKNLLKIAFIIIINNYNHNNEQPYMIDGPLNFASYFPKGSDGRAPPDLGPKVYAAMGYCAETKTFTETKMHLDIGDAFNLTVHVGDPPIDLPDDMKAEGLEGVSGAIWDIWKPEDKEKISQLLKFRAEEMDVPVSETPIHDQFYYINAADRARLKEEFGVVGFRFVQGLGDMVVVPAGAPHQVF
ncbi:hypothetical protein T492DRAFT_309546 [Pavlovales sp. CCMP2436]|nr:hypothetical protein T492DRAFT_309546 [Pavlovales sp. CCMP2436]